MCIVLKRLNEYINVNETVMLKMLKGKISKVKVILQRAVCVSL
jgi:hypothetical protein